VLKLGVGTNKLAIDINGFLGIATEQFQQFNFVATPVQ